MAPDAGFGHVAVVRTQGRSVIRQVVEQGAQVLEIEQQPAVLVRDPVGDIEHTFLDLVEPHEAGEQQGAHLCQGSAHRVTLRSEDVPEGGGAGSVLEAFLGNEIHLPRHARQPYRCYRRAG